MTNAISGDFVTVQHVPTRKCWKLTIEVAEENISQVFDVLGYPTSGESVSVGIARLVGPVTSGQALPPESAAPDNSAAEVTGKRHLRDMPLSNQAALKIDSVDFQRFLHETHTKLWKTHLHGIPNQQTHDTRKKTADAVVKALLNIKSKAELDDTENQAAIGRWETLLGDYEGWKHGVKDVA